MEKQAGKIRLKEGEDYYMDGGLMVFTGTHHLKRGYCCQNDCRHCPYSSTKEKTKKTKNHG